MRRAVTAASTSARTSARPEGNEVYAVVTGVISQIYTDAPGSLAGNGLRIRMADGTWFFYAHLSALAPGIAVGTGSRPGSSSATSATPATPGSPTSTSRCTRAAARPSTRSR